MTAASRAASRNSPAIAPLLALAQPRPDVLAQLVDRVEARLLGERVVDLGQLLRLDLLDGDGELGVLPGEVLGAVVLRERHLDRDVVIGVRALELVLEARDEPAGAELDELVATFATLERHAVDRADVVDGQEVAVLGRALDGVEPGEAIAQRVDLSVDRLVGGLRLRAADLEVAVRAELRLGAHADLDREREGLAARGQVADVQRRLADGRDARGVDGVDVPLREEAADGLVEDGVAADPLDDDGRRDLPLAEARDPEITPELAGGAVERALDLG